ncbi:MAG: hypothetical protein RR224_11090 [Clostridia bacterium]
MDGYKQENIGTVEYLLDAVKRYIMQKRRWEMRHLTFTVFGQNGANAHR